MRRGRFCSLWEQAGIFRTSRQINSFGLRVKDRFVQNLQTAEKEKIRLLTIRIFFAIIDTVKMWKRKVSRVEDSHGRRCRLK